MIVHLTQAQLDVVMAIVEERLAAGDQDWTDAQEKDYDNNFRLLD